MRPGIHERPGRRPSRGTAARRLRWAWLAALSVLVPPARATLVAQVPSRIPSTPEEQIFNLIKRVSTLEQQNAALQQRVAALAKASSGGVPGRVTAPFEVVDRAGRPILRVVEGEPAGGGVVITGGARHGVYVLDAQSGARVVAVGQSPDGHGALAVRDRQGQTFFVVTQGDPSRAGGAGVVITGDPGADAHGLFIRNKSGVHVAALGKTPDGYGSLVLRDETGTTRAQLAGEGSLRIADEAGNAILRVADQVSPEDAAVIIGSGEGDAYTVQVAGEGVSAVMGASNDMAGFATMKDGKPVGSLMIVNGRPTLEITNESGVSVAALWPDDAGSGYLQIGDAAGNAMIEAGVTAGGVGLVRARPLGTPGAGLVGMPGTFIIGRREQ